MQIELLNPVPGISAEAVTIGAGASSTDVVVHIDQPIPEARSIPLRFRAVGTMDEDVQVVSEAKVILVLRDREAPVR